MSVSQTPRWATLFQKALLERAPLLEKSNAYRILNGIADGADGIVVDLYGSHCQLQFFSRYWFHAEEEICQAILEVVQPQFLVVKERLDPNGASLAQPILRVVHGKCDESKTEVWEGKAKFVVDLLDTVNPGLFLDMRSHRLAVAELATQGEMLNLFCYTGSFSVHARLAGAERSVNVDVSAKILERVKENYAKNGITPQKGEFFRGDALEYLQYAARKGLKFQTIVLDPPSFSRSERGIFQVRSHLAQLVEHVIPLLAPHGHFFVSTNYSAFLEEDMRSLLSDTFSAKEIPYQIKWMKGQDEDFKGSGSRRESWLVAALVQRI